MEKMLCKTELEKKPKPMKKSYIPLPIIQVILSELPFIYLPSCRLVSKPWNDMVLSSSSSTSSLKFVPNSAPVFVSVCDEFGNNLPSNSGRVCLNYIDIDAKHSNGIDSLASFKFDLDWPYKYNIIVNSCKGLLLMIHECRRDYSCLILNPMTNEHMKLPMALGHRYRRCSYSYGLGFSLKTKQYKIVRFSFHDSDDRDSFGHSNNNYDRVCKVDTLEILTLGNEGEWRSIDDHKPGFICKKFHGVYLNGALYWIGHGYIEKKKRICCFDVEDEKFEEVSFPVNSINDYAVCINVLKGSFCANFCNKRKKPMEIELWSMIMHDDGGTESWIKEYVFEDVSSIWWINSSNFQLVKVYYKDGEMLYLIQSWDLFLYNPKAKTCKIKRKNGSLSHGIYEIDSPSFDSLENMLAGDHGL